MTAIENFVLAATGGEDTQININNNIQIHKTILPDIMAIFSYARIILPLYEHNYILKNKYVSGREKEKKKRNKK